MSRITVYLNFLQRNHDNISLGRRTRINSLLNLLSFMEEIEKNNEWIFDTLIATGGIEDKETRDEIKKR